MKSYLPLVFAAGVGLMSAAIAADGGRIFVVDGAAMVERDGQSYRASRGGLLQQGDTITTVQSSRVQWWMEDESIYTLGPESKLTISEYQINRKTAEQAQGLGRLTLNLLKGGFRSISGFIGSRNRDAYRVNTPTATMGIRGTDYTLFYIGPTDAAKLVVLAGSYVEVTTGSVALGNGTGATITVNAGQIGFAPDDGNAPTLITAMPAAIALLLGNFGFEFEQDFLNELNLELRIEPGDDGEQPISPS